MNQLLFVGVDGGATKCVVRVEDVAGRLLGRETSGPANIRNSVTQTWQSIEVALTQILQSHAICLDNSSYQFHAGMGLSGCEKVEAYEAFLQHPHVFKTLIVTSDAKTACLGAHGGEDGAIIIAGTGVVGYQIENGKNSKVGGWGFPHDDAGGGAWLGMEAIRMTLSSLDGRLPESTLTKAIFQRFDNHLDRFVSFANQANSTNFAEFAPIVIQLCEQQVPEAIALMRRAAYEIDRVGDALQSAQQTSAPLPCAMLGGVSGFIQPYLGKALQSRLRPCLSTPDVGAMILLRDAFKDHHD